MGPERKGEEGEREREGGRDRDRERQILSVLLPDVPPTLGASSRALRLWQPCPCLPHSISRLGWFPTCHLQNQCPSPAIRIKGLSQAASSRVSAL